MFGVENAQWIKILGQHDLATEMFLYHPSLKLFPYMTIF